LGGAKYFAIFVDDYPHKTWVYMMKKKTEVLANNSNISRMKVKHVDNIV
jgi:hypothetical protein